MRTVKKGFGILMVCFALTTGIQAQEAVNKQVIDKKTRIQPSGQQKKSTSSKSQSIKKENISTHYIALKTNIAYDAIAIANLAVEVQCSKHISVELPISVSLWDLKQEKGIRTVLLQPEVRWWMKEAGKGHFFGAHAHIGWFNVKWDDNRYQDTGRPLLGAGLSYGYLLPISKHWGAEFTLGAGYANMKYNTYYNIDNGAQIDTESRNYWGITRVGLSLSYRF